jgi:hypothetical protein
MIFGVNHSQICSVRRSNEWSRWYSGEENLQIHRTSPPVIPVYRFTLAITIRARSEVGNRGGAYRMHLMAVRRGRTTDAVVGRW